MCDAVWLTSYGSWRTRKRNGCHLIRVVRELLSRYILSGNKLLWDGNLTSRLHCRVTRVLRFACIWRRMGVSVLYYTYRENWAIHAHGNDAQMNRAVADWSKHTGSVELRCESLDLDHTRTDRQKYWHYTTGTSYGITCTRLMSVLRWLNGTAHWIMRLRPTRSLLSSNSNCRIPVQYHQKVLPENVYDTLAYNKFAETVTCITQMKTAVRSKISKTGYKVCISLTKLCWSRWILLANRPNTNCSLSFQDFPK